MARRMSSTRFAMAVMMILGVAALGAAAPLSLADAVAPPINGSGAVFCPVATGAVKFTPSLVVGNTSSTTIKVSVKGIGCLANSSASGNGLNVTNMKIAGTLTGAQDGYCAESAIVPTGTLKITYKVAPNTPKLNPTFVTFNELYWNGSSPASGYWTGSVASGSFVGGNYGFFFQTTHPSACGASWKLVSGSTAYSN